MLSGRDPASVNAENSTAPATVTTNWLNTMSLYDTKAPAVPAW